MYGLETREMRRIRPRLVAVAYLFAISVATIGWIWLIFKGVELLIS
jgi:hypothetical protein